MKLSLFILLQQLMWHWWLLSRRKEKRPKVVFVPILLTTNDKNLVGHLAAMDQREVEVAHQNSFPVIMIHPAQPHQKQENPSLPRGKCQAMHLPIQEQPRYPWVKVAGQQIDLSLTTVQDLFEMVNASALILSSHRCTMCGWIWPAVWNGQWDNVFNFSECANAKDLRYELIDSVRFWGVDFDCRFNECRCLYDQGTLDRRNSRGFDRTVHNEYGYGSTNGAKRNRSSRDFYCGKLAGAKLMEADKFLEAGVLLSFASSHADCCIIIWK